MNWKWVLLVGIAASLSAAHIKAPSWENSRVVGRDLYRENCAVCHDIDKDKMHSRKFGPSLNHLFKNPRLPLSRGKPNRPYVTTRIKFGGALMPAFRNKLDDSKINTLMDYIASK
ncbi:MAG: c-type cytochrome [Bryobacteraceae bacterium]